MLTLRSLHIQGFRGFRDRQEIRFDRPVTLLFGQNHAGKSSTLNALEWCLFGDECTGARTTIRERVGWVVANQYLDTPEVQVELQLDGPEGTHTIRRGLLGKARRRAPTGSLELHLPDGETLTGAPAEEHLKRLLPMSFRDFLTTVYQHQEIIRGILTQEPRDRNDAIDRLLGLSDYRNLLGGLRQANPQARLKDAGKQLAEFERQAAALLVERERDLSDKRREAIQAGLAPVRLTERDALELAGEVSRALQTLSTESSSTPQAIEPPASWKGLAPLEKTVRRALGQLRTTLPDLNEHATIAHRKHELDRLRVEYQELHKQQEEIARQTRALDREYGGQTHLAAEIERFGRLLQDEQAQLRQADRRAALLREAIGYLEEGEKGQAGHCPVCEAAAPKLLVRLRGKLETALEARSREIAQRIASLEETLRKLPEAAREYQQWNARMQEHRTDLDRCRAALGGLLGKDIADTDDPLPLLNEELDRVARRLKSLEEAVHEKQARLNQIEEKLEQVRAVREFLQAEEKKKIIEQVRQSRAYQEVETARGRLADLVADAEAVRDAVSAAANEEARAKLAAAEKTIDDYFRRLTRHPAVTRVRLQVEQDTRSGRNEYAITDQDGRDLTPILSQGDLNALALAVFLGLASAGADSGPLGFVLLDDPSQSLGSEYKKHLVEVLDQVAAGKQVVLATMDQELVDYLGAGLTRPRADYRFDRWTPQSGTRVRRA